MEYREFAPTLALAPFVERLWTLTGHAAALEGASQPVLPDGRPEIVIHFGDRFARAWIDGRVESQARILFAGQLTEQLVLQPTGRIAVLGVRFHPFGASAVLRVPQHQLAGLTPDLHDLSAPVARALRDVSSRTDRPDEAVPIVQAILERHVDHARVDPRIRAAATYILATSGTVSIDALAEHVSMSRRHLERRFLDAVGMPPKRLARVARFQQAVRALEASDSPQRGAVTAAACGYADQPHFIREFKELAGCSPAEHLMQRATLTGFFLTGSDH